jgi:N6-L-threonylcarbamoyladenine synthase
VKLLIKYQKCLVFLIPGGPQIEKNAQHGSEDRIEFPVAETKDYDFSFSGLKTAVLRYIQKNYPDKNKIPENDLQDIAASFQKAAIKALILKTKKAIENNNITSLSLAGGVAANKKLREAFQELSIKYGKKLIIPDLQFCGDNAAMIAFRGKTLYESGKRFNLDYSPYPGFRFEEYK